MKQLIALALGLAIAAVACSSAAAQTPARPATSIKGSCIDPRNITSQTIVSEQEIQFKLRNGETWVNKLPKACFGLKIEGGFSWDLRGTMACSKQERITVLRSGTHCLLGEFSKQG